MNRVKKEQGYSFLAYAALNTRVLLIKSKVTIYVIEEAIKYHSAIMIQVVVGIGKHYRIYNGNF